MRILIVEDDFIGAQQLASEIRSTGNSVIGPFPTLSLAMPHVGSIDAAILDVWLGNTVSFPVADALVRAGVPFLFLTAHDSRKVPDRLSHVRIFAKPSSTETLLHALEMPEIVLETPGANGEPVESVLLELIEQASSALPDRLAAERLVASVLREAISNAADRRDGEDMGEWLRDLLNDELRNHRGRHFH